MGVHTGNSEASLSALGRRVGILGGTFDPVHLGHLAAAAAVRQGLQLDSVLFIPAATPPHKPEGLTPFDHRFAMLALALRGRSDFFISDLEAERAGPSYSIDTLSRLRRTLSQESSLFFILGVDAFVEINSWKEYHQLPQYAHLVVIDRPPYRPEQVAKVIRNHFPAFRYQPVEEGWVAGPGSGRISLFRMEPLDISSTRIREKVRGGESVQGLVVPEVAEYISEQGLYRR